MADLHPTDLKTVSFRCHNRSSARRPAHRRLRGSPAPSQRGETITQPISKRFLSGVITGLRHGDLAQKDTRVIPAPSPHHPRAIPAPSQPGKSVFYRMLADSGPFSWTSRCSLGAPVGLRHGAPSHNHLSGIPAWRSSHLSALRHGDPVHRHLRAISTWQSSHLSALRHGDPAQRYPRGIILWRDGLKSVIYLCSSMKLAFFMDVEVWTGCLSMKLAFFMDIEVWIGSLA